MKTELKKPEYAGLELVATVYGNDDDQKSFQETQGLLQTYPDLKVDHLADDGRHRGGRPLPVRLGVQGQGRG